MRNQPETFETSTLLNGAPVDVIMAIDRDADEYGESTSVYLWAVMYEGVDILPVLDHAAVLALESEGEAAMSDWSFENRNV